MTSLSDTLTVGLVLVLLFGSIALYLYTRIQQAEQKISLLESILLDLKMSSEINSYTELPAYESVKEHAIQQGTEEYQPFNDDEVDNDNKTKRVDSNAVADSEIKVKHEVQTPTVSGDVEDEESDNIDKYRSVIATAVKNEGDTENLPSASKIAANYEAMTLKELQNLAKTRGIMGAGSMKKGSIIEALKTSDRSTSSSSQIEPGSLSAGSFLETSSPFQGSESQ